MGLRSCGHSLLVISKPKAHTDLICGGIFTLFTAEHLWSSRHRSVITTVGILRVKVLDMSLQASLCSGLVVTMWTCMFKVYRHVLIKFRLCCTCKISHSFRLQNISFNATVTENGTQNPKCVFPLLADIDYR